MNIELRNVQYSAALSQETSAFVATIHVDGIKTGTAKNQGCGGPTSISPPDLDRRIKAWAKTLPKFDLNRGLQGTPDMREQDSDYLLDQLLNDFLLARDLRQATRSRVLYTRTDKPGIYQTNKLKPAEVAQIIGSEEFRARQKVDRILNSMDHKEALALYRPA